MSSPEKGLQHYVSGTVSYYLKKGGTYYSVNNKRSLLNALKDKKTDIRKFIRKNGIRMKDDPDKALAKIIAWYDGNNH